MSEENEESVRGALVTILVMIGTGIGIFLLWVFLWAIIVGEG